MSWYFAWSHSTANKVFLSCSCFARLKCLIFIPARQESQVVFTLCIPHCFVLFVYDYELWSEAPSRDCLMAHILKWNDWANIFILVRVRLLNKLSLEVVLLGQRCICQGVFLTGTPLQALGINFWESFSFCRLSLGWFNHINLGKDVIYSQDLGYKILGFRILKS